VAASTRSQPPVQPRSTRPHARSRAEPGYVDTVFSFATRKDAVTGDRVVNVTRVIDLIRAAGLVVVIITVSVARPRPGIEAPRNLAIAVTLGLSVAAWIVWMLAADRPRTNLAILPVMGAVGGVLAGLSPNSPAVAFGCAAAFSAGVRLKTEVSLASWPRPWPRS
jgi:hypothetical protein